MRSLVKYLVIVLLLTFPGLAWGQEMDQFSLDWEKALAGDELPLEFIQTVTTLFPGKETVTVDHVRRWSPTHWLVTRLSGNHGPLIFGSGHSGSWAMATDSNVMYESSEQLALYALLNPISFDPRKPLPPIIRERREGSSWVVECTFRNVGVSRLWIDMLKHRLVREEFEDEGGNILYRLTRHDFKAVSESDVEKRRMDARNMARRVFSSQQEWWHHVLIALLQRERADILLPQKLPEGMLMVMAVRDQDGTNQLRYSNGTQVISLFQRQAEGRIRDYFAQDTDFALFVTERQGKMVTIIGPYLRAQMEEIADSLRHLDEMTIEEDTN